MNGINLMIDTNAAIYLLNGNQKIAEFLDGKNICISFITELELLSKPGISSVEKKVIKSFLNDCTIYDINSFVKKKVIELKQSTKIKLPDAIIASTAQWLNVPLVSADTDMKRIKSLNLISFEI
ncbi:MAG: type II toxin-antitoxin system VapC family toxin [Bacteroidota bacterium]